MHSTAEDRRRPLGDYADGRCERFLRLHRDSWRPAKPTDRHSDRCRRHCGQGREHHSVAGVWNGWIAGVLCAERHPGIRVLAFNYFSFNHPDPQINFVLDLAVQSFSAGLQTRIAQIQSDVQTTGKTARVGFVDTFSAMEGRRGLLSIEKRNGFVGGFDFEIPPTQVTR